MSQGKVNLPLYFLSSGLYSSSGGCYVLQKPQDTRLLKGGQGWSERGPCWPGNSLVEGEEVSHDHDDHAGEGVMRICWIWCTLSAGFSVL